ncbi:MAG TPA: NrfD/PsrC family molybdoenzyme membrane anchor subunit [Candidatus Sulfomarinibacteraceae bacterium]|nr:NrfD/PsrC family molybdoenzyme membrane anchor subunit [Candidatus Sulfomarinibacteraceae bacterium]
MVGGAALSAPRLRWLGEARRVAAFLASELRPRGPWLTPFNMISLPVMAVGATLIAIRFSKGLGSVTNLTQETPWGFWIGFDVVTGVAFAGGAYLVTFAVYVMGAERYHPIVPVTVLNGFLAYVFYAGALVLDVGRPWKMVNPIIGNSFGYNSILFLVAWHFMLYMIAELIEFSPVIAEWLGWSRARRALRRLTLVTVIFGVTLSTLHQSGLGALFLLAKSKIHPLWYSEFLPVLFLVSSVFAGLSMVIFEGTLSHRFFGRYIDRGRHAAFDEIVVGLARGAAVTLFLYLFFKALVFVHGTHWVWLGDAWGWWYLVEVVGFVLVPCVLFARGVRLQDLPLIRLASVITLAGIVLNRLNVSVIAFNWRSANPYVPSWMELVITAAIIFSEIWVFRWVVTRMPVLQSSPLRAIEREHRAA